jgi:hypothetical protein
VRGREFASVDFRRRPNAVTAPNDSAGRMELIKAATAFRVTKPLKKVIEEV